MNVALNFFMKQQFDGLMRQVQRGVNLIGHVRHQALRLARDIACDIDRHHESYHQNAENGGQTEPEHHFIGDAVQAHTSYTKP